MCASLSMNELVSLTRCKRFAMLLRTYIDDSADETRERAIVAGAYIGFYHQWNALQKQWRKRLKQDGLKYFRTSEYYSWRGEFARYRNPTSYPKPNGQIASKALFNDLEEIIHQSKVMGIAVCVDMKDYSDIRTNEPGGRILPEDAFEVALQSLVKICAEIVRDDWNVNPRQVAFVCDESSSSARITKVYTEFKAINPSLAEFMGGLVHQDDKKFPQLQSADMMAHLAKGRFIDWLDDPKKATFTNNEALKERLNRLSVHQIAVWDRKYMLDVLRHELQIRGSV